MLDWRRCLAEDPRCSKKWACFRSRHCQSGRRSGACAWIQAVNFQQATTESLTSLSHWFQDAHTSPAQAIHYPSATSDTPFFSSGYTCCKYILNELSHISRNGFNVAVYEHLPTLTFCLIHSSAVVMVSGNYWGNGIKVSHAICDLSFNHTWISEVTQERICKFKLPSWQTKLFLLLQSSFFSPNSLISNPEKENVCPSSPQLSQQQQTPEACMYPASLWTPTIVSLSFSTWVHQAQA